jgi:cell fate regulator YaaT (PSP1 superfamily)
MDGSTRTDYLVSFGNAGDFSRFRSDSSVSYQRGDRVVVRSHQGVELGVVMCAATGQHSLYLSEQPMGDLLRQATPDDEAAAQRAREWGNRLFNDARDLTNELGLPLEILDVEVSLDGKQAMVLHLRRDDCDYRPLVSTLSKRHDILLNLQNLAVSMELNGADHGCGRPDCGQRGGGGCATCGSGDGCSVGSCGKSTRKEDVAAYLAHLRQNLDRARMPLL